MIMNKHDQFKYLLGQIWQEKEGSRAEADIWDPFSPPRCSAQLVEAASEVSARSDEE